MMPHLQDLWISTGFDSIQTKDPNSFSTGDGDTQKKEMPVLPQKGFIQKLRKILQICTSGFWFLQTLPCITVRSESEAQRYHLIGEPYKNLIAGEEKGCGHTATQDFSFARDLKVVKAHWVKIVL